MEREKKTKAIEMTTGSIWKNLFFLSCPLVFSQVLEVLFNMSDVAVVGRFSDYRALGAVGSTTLLVTLFTGFLIGMGCGVNVRMAHELGARRRESVIKTVHSAFVICLIVGLLVGAACFFFAEGLLGILHTKEELMDSAVLYLKIYALGMPGMALYNCGNGILSATGDTKRPLLYLSIAGIVNVILNLFFVIVCHMAAEGGAIASVIGQYLSALLIVIHLLRRTDDCGLHPSKLRLDPACTKAILVLGIPTGIQNAIFAIANLFVQSGVNSFDAVMVSGNAAAANADTLIFNIMAAFYTGCSSFIGQNWGAGNRERMKKSYLVGLTYSFAAGAIFGGLLLIFGRQFLSLFATEPAVIDAGMQRVKIMGFSYMISAFMDCSIAASRGIGKSIVPMVIVILGSCVFRVIWVYTIFVWIHTIPALYSLYFFSWAITSVAEVLYFRHSFRQLEFQS